MNEKQKKEISEYLTELLRVMNASYFDKDTKVSLIERILTIVYLSGRLDYIETMLLPQDIKIQTPKEPSKTTEYVVDYNKAVDGLPKPKGGQRDSDLENWN